MISIVSGRFIYQNEAEIMLKTGFEAVLPNLYNKKSCGENKIVYEKTQKFDFCTAVRFDLFYRLEVVYTPKCRWEHAEYDF